MKRYVVYSAICGNYDVIRQPIVVDNRFDYILFTNEIEETSVGIWQVRKIAYFNPDNTRICRYVKTHPEELLSEYEISIWMDSNIQIITDYIYNRVFELENDNVLISSMWHPTGCIYQEAFDVVHMMIEHEKKVIKWCHKLRQEGYPRKNGLCETGVLYRKHSDSSIIAFDKYWWKCIDENSKRDQLSFNFSLWKFNLPCHYLMGEKNNVRNTKHFDIQNHNNLSQNHCQISKNEAWLMRYCWKKEDKRDEIANVYYRIYAFPFPLFAVAIVGQYYRIKFFLDSYGE